MSNTPHDKLFKRAFQTPLHMEGVLRTVLPSKLVEHIRWDTLHLESGTWVDPVLKDRHSDLVFSAKLGERDLLAYALTEHQSQEDPIYALRAWIYLGRLLDGWLSSQLTKPRRIPVVVAVVIYHGERPWQGSTELLDLYDLPSQTREDIAEYLPRLRIIIDDLTRLTDDEVRERTQLTVCARLVQGILRDLRFARDKGAVVRGWWRLANQAETEPAGLSILEAVAYYVLTVVPEETRPEVLGIMQENVSENARSAVRTAADSLREEGEAHGLARAVVGVFEARGIPISDDARHRIMACQDTNQLERWLRRAAVADAVGEIFEV